MSPYRLPAKLPPPTMPVRKWRLTDPWRFKCDMIGLGAYLLCGLVCAIMGLWTPAGLSLAVALLVLDKMVRDCFTRD